MAIDVTCVCGRAFAVTNNAMGRRVRCPECRARFKVTATNTNLAQQSNNVIDESRTPTTDDHAMTSSHTASESDRADSAPRQSKSAMKKERAANRRAESALHKSSVPLGIAWMYYGLLIGVIAMIGLCSMVLLSQTVQPGQGSPLAILFGLPMVFAAGLMIVGKLFCLSAPSQIPGSGGVLLSLVFDGFAVLIAIAQRGQSPGLSLLANLLGVGSFVCFLVFLKGLGEFLELRDIADRAAGVLLLGLLSLAVWIAQLGFMSLVRAREVPPGVGGMGLQMLGLVLGGLGIFVVVRFAGLLSMCRSALSKP